MSMIQLHQLRSDPQNLHGFPKMLSLPEHGHPAEHHTQSLHRRISPTRCVITAAQLKSSSSHSVVASSVDNYFARVPAGRTTQGTGCRISQLLTVAYSRLLQQSILEFLHSTLLPRSRLFYETLSLHSLALKLTARSSRTSFCRFVLKQLN
jgi:hypothetical protein